jgi:hypothetical protein
MKGFKYQIKTRVVAVIAITFFALMQAGAQNQKATVQFNPQTGLVDVNGVTMDGVATFDLFKEKLGLPSGKKDYPNGETSIFYESLGIVFSVQENFVKGLGITFNTDGDKKFPATSLHGILTIGEVEITKASKQETFRSLSTPKFTCPFELLCASENREAATKSLAGFKDGVVTQVTFLVNEQ